MFDYAGLSDADLQILDWHEYWYRKFGTCPPGASVSEARTSILIHRGVLTPKQAHMAGFPLSQLHYIQAREKR